MAKSGITEQVLHIWTAEAVMDLYQGKNKHLYFMY